MGLNLKIPLPTRRPGPGVLVSAGVHAALLTALLASYSFAALPEAQEGIPVEIVTENMLSQITKGEKDAKTPAPDAKPRADRIAEKIVERDPGEAAKDVPSPPKRPRDVQVADADEMPPPPTLRPTIEKTEAPPTPPARPDTAKADAAREAAKAEAAKEAKAEAAKAEAKAVKEAAAKEAAVKAEAEKREELAELIREQQAEAAKEAAVRAKAEAKARAEAKAKAEAKAEAAKEAAEAKAEAAAKAAADAKAVADAKAAMEAKAVADAKAEAKAKSMADARAKAAAEAKARRQAEAADKFSAGDIRSLLASKEPAQSTGSTGREVQRVASLGAMSGTAQRLNPSQRDALIGMLQSQIERCYSAPPGASQGIVLPMLEIRLNVDGSLTSEPRILRAGGSSVDRSIADAAVRAVRRCASYRIPEQYKAFYNDWKEIRAEFELPAN